MKNRGVREKKKKDEFAIETEAQNKLGRLHYREAKTQ